MKIKVKIAALELDDFVRTEQLKSLIYVDRPLHDDPIKEKLIDELNLKNCVHAIRSKTSKLFLGITLKKGS